MRFTPSRPMRAGVALLAIAATPVATDPAGGILEFHAVAMTAIADPLPASALRVACAQKVGPGDSFIGVAGWWSLLAPATDRAIPGAVIAVFTRDQVRKPADVITTQVRYDPMPTAMISRKASLDWAWIWDRNGDGRAVTPPTCRTPTPCCRTRCRPTGSAPTSRPTAP